MLRFNIKSFEPDTVPKVIKVFNISLNHKQTVTDIKQPQCEKKIKITKKRDRARIKNKNNNELIIKSAKATFTTVPASSLHPLRSESSIYLINTYQHRKQYHILYTLL